MSTIEHIRVSGAYSGPRLKRGCEKRKVWTHGKTTERKNPNSRRKMSSGCMAGFLVDVYKRQAFMKKFEEENA